MRGKTQISLALVLAFSLLLTIFTALQATSHGRNSSDLLETKARQVLTLAETSGFKTPAGQKHLQNTHALLEKAIALRPIALQTWLLDARTALILATTTPSQPHIARLEKSLSMAHLSGRHIILPAARHRLMTALWAQKNFPNLALSKSGMQQDIAMLAQHWLLRDLARTALKTGTTDMIRASLPKEPQRQKAFDYYLIKERQS
ncbi:MAG TPA: hypothetical protein DCW68_01485 [Rhodospirillaceae bacterium]|nr:MAG: hypothetical protein A2018_04450 [Alphaproteobacteria bacterium GWF2_58_20]HAU28770.1 hypothetical protein [Rhodospirillaceae bacterium]